LAGKDEKRKKRPVVTPSPKIPAPKRIPGGRPTQPKYEKPRQPEGTTGPAPSKIEPPTAKPGKGPDRSLSGHLVELGEKKEEKTPAKPQVRVISKKLTVGIVVGLIAAGGIAGILSRLGVFGGGGGGGAQTWTITCSGNVATLTVDSSGSFTGYGWMGSTPSGSYSIPITDGSMYGTTMTFTANATYDSGQGTIYETGLGTLDEAFPNATYATGTCDYTISDPLGTRSGSLSWTATKIS